MPADSFNLHHCRQAGSRIRGTLRSRFSHASFGTIWATAASNCSKRFLSSCRCFCWHCGSVSGRCRGITFSRPWALRYSCSFRAGTFVPITSRRWGVVRDHLDCFRDHCLGRRPLSWFFPLLMFAWAKLHPGVIMGQGLICGAIGWEWCNLALRWNKPLTKPQCIRLTIVGGAGPGGNVSQPAPHRPLLVPVLGGGEALGAKAVRGNAAGLSASHRSKPSLALARLSDYRRRGRYDRRAISANIGCGKSPCCLASLGLANLALRSLQDWTLYRSCRGRASPLAAALARKLMSPVDLCRGKLYAVIKRLDRSMKGIVASRAFRPNMVWPIAGFLVLVLISCVPAWSKLMPVQNSKEWPVAALKLVPARRHPREFLRTAGLRIVYRMEAG